MRHLVVRMLTAGLCLNACISQADEEQRMDKPDQEADRTAFERAKQGEWREVFFDPGTENWQEKWFLDGEIASVRNTRDGMQLTAGPQFGNDAHHMVLWTKDSFEGDLKIEFEFTRLDFESDAVNIIYIQATGVGEEPYLKDIAEWSELRRVPSMREYFGNMHTFHISYAAFPNQPDERDGYIRGRRYMPENGRLAGTTLSPEYFPPAELFAPGIPHQMTVIKRGKNLLMRVERPNLTYYCHMSNPELPAVTEGRVGLRQMFTRSARYKNFRISVLEE